MIKTFDIDRGTISVIPCRLEPLTATWPSGKAGVCKTLIPGSNPGVACLIFNRGQLAQLVAHLIDIQGVAGSSPALPR